MTSLDPLKSVMTIDSVEDTSLALPSVNQYGTGQQRVWEQVQKVRRSKSRHGSSRSGSTSLSPTEFTYDSVDSLKSPSSVYMNGNVFTGNGVYQGDKYGGPLNWKSLNNLKSSQVKRNTESSFYQYGTHAPVGSVTLGKAKTSRSEPDLVHQRIAAKGFSSPQKLPSQRSTYRERERPRSFHQPQHPHHVNGTVKSKSNKQVVRTVTTTTKALPKPAVQVPVPIQVPVQVQVQQTKKKEEFVCNGNSGAAKITMKEAVEYLTKPDEAFQHCGASYIQHNAYMDDNGKEEVLKYNGIPPLISLLRSPNSSLSQTASAALRNLSFKNIKAKEEIQHCGGIRAAVALLQETDSTEVQKQLTGLLWNMSSADSLKPDLLKNALPVLMERVVLPYTTMGNNTDPEVFLHATECLRNMSCTKQSYRQTMRKCRGLVDSLVSYVKDCINAGKPDEKSVDNCVCTLHNLTFQLEAEAPVLFTRITALANNLNRKNSQNDVGPIGCFSPQSKAPEHERYFDFAVIEDPHPSGAGGLIHSKTIQSYLTLLGSSQKEETQEASCGAMQNLTLHDGMVSSVMSHTIVNKLNGLQVIGPLLKSSNVNLQKNVVSLVHNLTRNSSLHKALVRNALPQLVAIIRSKEENKSDDTLAVACQAANCLFIKDPEMSKHLLNKDLVNSLQDLSRNSYLRKSCKAASLLLYNLWSEKDTQSYLKKLGLNKSSFVNDITTAVHKSVQVVD